jgi:hypothetical protein
MNEDYKIEDIVQTVKTCLFSMHSAMCLCCCYKNNEAVNKQINNNISGIAVNEYILPKETQEYALQNVSLERFVISSSLRGVFSAMYEGLKNNAIFKRQIESILIENYSNFFALINLLRNFYSHELTWSKAGEIIIKPNDFEGFVRYRNTQDLSKLIRIDIKYKDILPSGVPVSDDYGIKFELHIGNLKEQIKLHDIFPMDVQFKLAELCHNLCNMM